MFKFSEFFLKLEKFCLKSTINLTGGSPSNRVQPVKQIIEHSIYFGVHKYYNLFAILNVIMFLKSEGELYMHIILLYLSTEIC